MYVKYIYVWQSGFFVYLFCCFSRPGSVFLSPSPAVCVCVCGRGYWFLLIILRLHYPGLLATPTPDCSVRFIDHTCALLSLSVLLLQCFLATASKVFPFCCSHYWCFSQTERQLHLLFWGPPSLPPLHPSKPTLLLLHLSFVANKHLWTDLSPISASRSTKNTHAIPHHTTKCTYMHRVMWKFHHTHCCYNNIYLHKCYCISMNNIYG